MASRIHEETADEYLQEDHNTLPSSTGETSDGTSRARPNTQGFGWNINLERHVTKHEKIPIHIHPKVKKPAGTYATQSSLAIGTAAKMVFLRDAPTQEGPEPLLGSVICEKVLGKRSGCVKGMGCGSKRPKSTRSGGSSGSGPTQRELEREQIILSLRTKVKEYKDLTDNLVQRQSQQEEKLTMLTDMVKEFMDSRRDDTKH